MELRKRKSYIGAGRAVAVLCGLFCALALAFGAATRFSASADEPPAAPRTVSSVLVKPETSCAYRYFTYPTALYADGNGFTVADETRGCLFSADGAERVPDAPCELPEGATALALINSADNTYIALANGKLYKNATPLFGNDPAEPDESDGDPAQTELYFNDIAAFEGTLYAAADNAIYTLSLGEETPTQPVLYYEHASAVRKITADGNGIYFTAPNALNRYQSDIWFVKRGNAAPDSAKAYYTASEEILALKVRADGSVAALTRGGITAYERTGTTESDTVLTEKFAVTDTDAVTIAAAGNDVYALGQEKNVFRLNADFTERTDLLASAAGGTGFFRANAGIFSRKQMIAVADERNDRVQILGENGVAVLSVPRPKAVVIDYERNVYVAHANNVSVYNADLQLLRTLAAPAGVTVTDLQIDSYNNVFARGSNRQVYFLAHGELPYATVWGAASLPANAVAMNVGHNDALYIATSDDKLVCIQNGTAKTVASDARNIVSICTDLHADIYALTSDGAIEKYTRTVSETYAVAQTVTPAQPFVKATAIAMNTSVFGESARLAGGVTLAYGDLLISDSGAHAVKAIPCDALNVNDGFNVNAAPPEIDEVPRGETAYGILYTVSACDVYAQAAEITRVAGLRNGMKVIIPRYDETAAFQLVIADNLAGVNEKPVVGYVRNAFIGERLPYTAPPAESCYSYVSDVKVYAYPTFNSPAVTEKVARNTRFTLLPFPAADGKYGYADNLADAGIWYRVLFDDNGAVREGYVPCDSISLRGENPDDRNVYPRTNAKVIKTAALYEKIDGEMVEVTDAPFVPLAKGTKVEVVGAFDSSEKYTLIKYYHEGLGTVQFYVLTKNLKYSGVNKVTVIAVVLIVLTVILGAVLIARFLYVKRTRKLNNAKL